MNLYKNFLAMPVFLKLITLLAALSPTISFMNTVSGGMFWFFGKAVSASEWWGSGAGLCQSIFDVVMLMSAFFFLSKYKWAKLIYILGILLLPLVNSITSYLLGVEVKLDDVSVVVIEVVSVVVFAYLMLSRGVQEFMERERKGHV